MDPDVQLATASTCSPGSTALRRLAAPRITGGFADALAALAGRPDIIKDRQHKSASCTTTTSLEDALVRLRQDISGRYTRICAARGISPPILIGGRIPFGAAANNGLGFQQTAHKRAASLTMPALQSTNTAWVHPYQSLLQTQHGRPHGQQAIQDTQGFASGSGTHGVASGLNCSNRRSFRCPDTAAALVQLSSPLQIRQQMQAACTSLTSTSVYAGKAAVPLESSRYKRKPRITDGYDWH